jgi:DNA-binding CsgD family transcriptional regulator
VFRRHVTHLEETGSMTNGWSSGLLVGALDGRRQRARWPMAAAPAPRALAVRDRTRLALATSEARLALEEAANAVEAAAAHARSVAATLDEALAQMEAAAAFSTPEPRPPAFPRNDVSQLSPREREVLALVAEGHSNKAIAEALYVSPNTVKTHVASLFHKLHAETRAQLAAIAARQ